MRATSIPKATIGVKPASFQPRLRRFPVPMTPARIDLDPARSTSFVGSDGMLEIDVPAGAVTATDVAAAGGKLSLLVRQVLPASGSNAGGSGRYTFGTYLIQLVDRNGVPVQLSLRKPLSFKLHMARRTSALDLAHVVEVLNPSLSSWLDLSLPTLPSRPPAGAPAQSPNPGSSNASGARADAGAPAELFADLDQSATSTQAMLFDPSRWTVSTTMTVTSSTAAVSFDTDAPVATFGKPDPFEADLSGGGLTAAFPLDLPAGPGGLKPPLTLAYNSAGVSDQHNPAGAAPWVGEGWNLTLGSISWAEHNVETVNPNNTPLWEDSWELSDPFGTAADLIPPDITARTYVDDTSNPPSVVPTIWHTAPETRDEIVSFTSPNPPPGFNPIPPCFRVFRPNGIMEEFGCTPDSLQFYPQPSGTNTGLRYVSGWLLDLITDPEGNQIHVTYQQDIATGPGGVSYPRDVEIATVEYDSPGCHNAQAACTGSTWQPLMRVSFQASNAVAHVVGSSCPLNGSLRCDDPGDLLSSGGLAAPLIQSTLVLNDALVQVRPTGKAPWSTLRDYQLGYDQSPSGSITDPVSGLQESAAGTLDLTQLKEVGADGVTSLPSRTFGYTLLREYYEDSLGAPTPSTNCGPSWNNGNTPNGHTGCILWSQSYGGNSFYLSSVGNGLGLQQTFSWQLARNNFHGVVSGTPADPFACNSATVQPAFPCNMPDDESWSRAVLTQRTATTLRPSQTGQGGTPATTTVSGVTTFSYQVPYPLQAQECSTCVASFYWGNQNDFDLLDFYNGKFFGFVQATIDHPDGGVEIHRFLSSEGWGLYDTGQISCDTQGGGLNNPCHNAPYSDLANAAHGHEVELDQFATDGTTLRQTKTQWRAVCPPAGVSGTQASSTYGNWNGNLVTELDHSNPVMACDIQRASEDTFQFDGAATPVHQTTTFVYDGLGRVVTETRNANPVVADSSGNGNEASWSGGVSQGIAGLVSGDSDAAMSFDGSSGTASLNLPNIDTTPGDKVTVEFWMKWSGNGNYEMPVGFDRYDLFINTAYGFGFNTSNSDIYGVPLSAVPKNQPIYVVAVFTNGAVGSNQLYLNGVAQKLTQLTGTALSPQVTASARISGWPTNDGYYFNGALDEVAIYNGALTQSQVSAHFTAPAGHYRDVILQTSPLPLAYYRLDEPSPSSPATIVNRTSYVQNDAVSATSGSATGTYLIDRVALQTTEDAGATQQACTYSSYDGQPFTSGQLANLTLGELTRVDRYASCGTTPSGQLSTTYIYDAYGNLQTSTDPDASAGDSTHAQCTAGATHASECSTYDSTFAVLPTAQANARNQVSSTAYDAPGIDSSANRPLIAVNSNFVWVAIGRSVLKYDRGASGPDMFDAHGGGIGVGGAHLIGYMNLDVPVTALALTNQYAYIGLADNRVVKTTMCGTGQAMCAFSDGIGTAGQGGTSYWLGRQDYAGAVSGLAVNMTNLFVNVSNSSFNRTIKTTLCGGGANMCALGGNQDGTSGLAGYSYWIGYQDWVGTPLAVAANDSFVYTAFATSATTSRVCRTTFGSSGANVFALGDYGCTSGLAGYGYWIGYQDWNHPVASIAIGGSSIWWGLTGLSRLVQTSLCGTGANICALSSGDGSGTVSGYSYWQGMQDWCPGYVIGGVGASGSDVYVSLAVDSPQATRIVHATSGSGTNLFGLAGCTGTKPEPGTTIWVGYQDTNSALTGYGLWPASRTDPNGQTSRIAYDALGREASETLPGDPAGAATISTAYTVWCTGTAAQTPCTEVDKTQRLNPTTTATYRAFYDGLGHLVETRSPAPGGRDVVQYSYYDPSQRIVFKSVPYFAAAYSGAPGSGAFSFPDSNQAGTSYSYDALGRQTAATDALSHTITTTRTAACHAAGTSDPNCYEQALATDANGHLTGTLTDALGRPAYDQLFTGSTLSSHAVYATTSYSYDFAGDLVRILHPDGTTKTTFQYDMAARKIGMSDPDRGIEKYVYDADGNLIQSVDARGTTDTVYIGYDGLDRPLWHNTTNVSGGAYYTFSYDSTAGGNDGIGRLTGESFASGALSGSYSYGYDGRGRQTSLIETVVGSASYKLQTTYNDASNVLTQTYPTGEVVSSGYTLQGWLSSLITTQGATSTSLLSGATYNSAGGAFGELTGAALGGGAYQFSAIYDPLDRATELSWKHGSTSVFDQQRTLDAAGNVSTIATTLPTGTDNQAFCYDEQDRLIWAGATGTPPCSSTAIGAGTLSAAQYVQSFVYDNMGRLRSGPLGSYAYGDTAHVHSATAVGSDWTASYDAAGDMTCRAPIASTTCVGAPSGAQLAYGPEGTLTAWQDRPASPGTTANFLYDPQGQRVVQQITQGGSTTTTVYVGDVEQVATTGGTTTTTTYYYASGNRIALGVNGTVNYLASDALGSASVTLNTSGSASASQLFAPYGGVRYSNGMMPTDYSFTGQRSDTASGLSYFGARYYDPVAGQFTSADTSLTSGILGLSRYAYVEGNPIGRTDPTGHDECVDDGSGSCVPIGGTNSGPTPSSGPPGPTGDPCVDWGICDGGSGGGAGGGGGGCDTDCGGGCDAGCDASGGSDHDSGHNNRPSDVGRADVLFYGIGGDGGCHLNSFLCGDHRGPCQLLPSLCADLQQNDQGNLPEDTGIGLCGLAFCLDAGTSESRRPKLPDPGWPLFDERAGLGGPAEGWQFWLIIALGTIALLGQVQGPTGTLTNPAPPEKRLPGPTPIPSPTAHYQPSPTPSRCPGWHPPALLGSC